MSKTTYAKLLNEYLFVGPMKPRYWQDYKDRMWLEHGVRIRAGDGTRERVLEEYRLERKRKGEALFKEILCAPSPLLSLIEKDTSWTGGTLIVPFKAKEPPRGVRFPPAPGGPVSDQYALTYTQIVCKKHVYWKFGAGLRAGKAINKAINKAMDDFVSSMKDKIMKNIFGKIK